MLRVGNLQTARDFSDVRDIVRGYVVLMEHGTPGEAYNLCGGEAVDDQHDRRSPPGGDPDAVRGRGGSARPPA